MLRKTRLSFFGLILLSIITASGYAQNPLSSATGGDWIKIQTDDRDFAIEMPAKHKFYSNENGFDISQGSGSYRLKKMRMINAFVGRSMLSLEIYDANKAGVQAIYEQDTAGRSGVEKTQFKLGTVKVIRTVVNAPEDHYVRQYVSYRNKIFVLTAVSRGSEGPEIRRFLDSVELAPEKAKLEIGTARLISQLKMTEVVVEQDLTPAPPKDLSDTGQPANAKDPSIVPVKFFSMPRASYTQPAREKGVQGIILLRLTLTEDGFIPRIVVVGKALGEGLIRHALFSALRIKFLPQEKNGVPETVEKKVEYSFSIY